MCKDRVIQRELRSPYVFFSLLQFYSERQSSPKEWKSNGSLNAVHITMLKVKYSDLFKVCSFGLDEGRLIISFDPLKYIGHSKHSCGQKPALQEAVVSGDLSTSLPCLSACHTLPKAVVFGVLPAGLQAASRASLHSCGDDLCPLQGFLLMLADLSPSHILRSTVPPTSLPRS